MAFALWNGILLGLLLTILIGPVFFALIDTSIKKGFRTAVAVALGISLSDAAYIGITNLGLSQFANSQLVQTILGYVGGVVLTVYGLRLILQKVTGVPVKAPYQYGDYLKNFFMGFSLNFLNPFVLVFWVSAVSFVRINYAFDSWERLGYFTATVATVLGTDLLKSYSAIRLRHLLTQKLLRRMNIVSGLVLLGFGIRLLVFAVAGV